ncbi:MAG: PatA/PatG family cyanobactin maturation protease, partial [Crocinitomicaceae bacterium]
IINISGGQFSKTGDANLFLQKAIDKCSKAGVLIVAAAGNDGCDCIHIPAANEQVLAVGSMDENGNPTPETNYGGPYKVNGILALGKNLTAASVDGGTFQTGGGTSYATPIVTGVLGLLMSLQLDHGVKPNAFHIKSILEKTSDPCIEHQKNDCRRFMRGSLNLPNALKAVMSELNIKASSIDEHNYVTNTINMTNTDKEVFIQTPESMGLKGTLQPCGDVSGMEESYSTESRQEFNIESDANESEIAPSLSMEIPAVGGTSETTTKNSNQTNTRTMENNTVIQTPEMIVEDNVLPQAQASLESIDPADCGCGGKSTGPALTYALGTVGYDFGSESHRDSFIQSMGGANPNDPKALLDYLTDNPWDAEEIIWTLNIDSTPIYRILPYGSGSITTYERIRKFLLDQSQGMIERISVPGLNKGKTTLLNGQSVPNLFPNLRGMYSWKTEVLIKSATIATKSKASDKELTQSISNFLNQVYYNMQNFGVSAEDRALNYAATNAYQVSEVFAHAVKHKLELDNISATKSPICRPGADCYDVVLTFFNPEERLTTARKQYRFTVDVSDVVPVTVGEVRSWSVY